MTIPKHKTKQPPQAAATIILLILLALLGPTHSSYSQAPSSSALTLSQAIDIALAQNRTLHLARLSVVDSKLKKEIARSYYFPEIKNGSSLRYITDLEGVVIPAGAFGTVSPAGPVPAKTLFLDQGSLTSYKSVTSLQQPITQLLKVHESNRIAASEVTTTQIKVRQAEDDVIQEVRRLYYSFLIAQLKKQAAEEEVKSATVKLEESTVEEARGQALQVKALESRAALLQAQQVVLAENLQLHDLGLSFNNLLGLPLEKPVRLDSAEAAAMLEVPGHDECLRIAEANNPDIQSAKQAVLQARAALGSAKDAYIPDISVFAHDFYQSGTSFEKHNFGAFGLTFNYDVFDGGRRFYQVKDARTLLQRAELNLTNLEETVNVQVQAGFDRVLQLRQIVSVSEESLKVRAESARLSDRKVEQNVMLASARAEAHAQQLSAQASLLESKLGLLLAEGDLKRQIGQPPL